MNINSSLDNFKSLLDTLTPKIGPVGGRTFVSSRDNTSYNMNTLVEQFGKIVKTSLDRSLIKSTLDKIEDLNIQGNNKLDRSSVLKTLLTKIRQLANVFFDRQKVINRIKDNISRMVEKLEFNIPFDENEISDFKNFSELKYFLQVQGHKLKSLDLSELSFRYQLKDSDVHRLVFYTPNLESLTLKYLNLDGSFLHKLNLQKLKSLNLANCSSLKEENLKNLIAPNLEELNISRVNIKERVNITGSCFDKLDLQKLKKLDLSGCKELRDDNLIKLNLYNIEELDLNSTNISGSCFDQLNLQKLKMLKLGYCERLTSKNLIKLNRSAPNIEKLCLNGTRISGACFDELSLKNLKKLDLYSCNNLTDENLKKLDLDNLEELCLRGTRISGACFDELSLKNLKQLDLSGCKKITDKNLEKLNSPNLEILTLYSTNIDGSCFDKLILNNLKELDLNYCKKITDQNLSMLKSSNLELLRLGDTEIDGSCFETMDLQKLTYLYFGFNEKLKKEYIVKLNAPNLYRHPIYYLNF